LPVGIDDDERDRCRPAGPVSRTLHDRDAVYGVVFSSRVQALGIREVKAAHRSPWQDPYVERLIGTLCRECLDHVVVLNETHLRRLLRNYLIYYHSARTHLSLDTDAP
jgi:hypothetical protein